MGGMGPKSTCQKDLGPSSYSSKMLTSAHLTDEETEARGGDTSYPRLHSD